MKVLVTGAGGRNINAIVSDRYKLVFECVLVGLMIDMMFEVIMGTTATWGCLLLLNSIHLFLEKQEDLFYYGNPDDYPFDISHRRLTGFRFTQATRETECTRIKQIIEGPHWGQTP